MNQSIHHLSVYIYLVQLYPTMGTNVFFPGDSAVPSVSQLYKREYRNWWISLTMSLDPPATSALGIPVGYPTLDNALFPPPPPFFPFS